MAYLEQTKEPLPMMAYRNFLLSLVVNFEDAAGDAIFGAEIGVALGETSRQLLEKFSGLTLLMVDWWQQAPEGSAYRLSGDKRARLSDKDHLERMRLAADMASLYQGRASLVRSDSVAAAARVADAALDFVFIDAAHDRASVAADLAAWWPKVRTGGLFCGHDYKHHKYHGVQESVDEFFEGRTEPFWLGPGDARAVWFTWKGAKNDADLGTSQS